MYFFDLTVRRRSCEKVIRKIRFFQILPSPKTTPKKRQQGYSSEYAPAADDSNYSLNGSCLVYTSVSTIQINGAGKGEFTSPVFWGYSSLLIRMTTVPLLQVATRKLFVFSHTFACLFWCSLLGKNKVKIQCYK